MPRTQWYWIGKIVFMERAFSQIAAAWHSRTIVAKLVSFATIGVLNAAVDLTVFSIAYKLFQLPLVLSNVIAWAVAVSGSYAMNTKLTFGRETGGAFRWEHYLRFAASGVLGVIVATTTLVILSQYTNVFAAKFVSILAAFGVNFSMSHFVVFRAVVPSSEPL
jgi:putative flippase GtrA